MVENEAIPFVDLGAQQKEIFSKIEERIFKVLSHGQYIMGPEIDELEEELANFAGVKHAITCSSGTDAVLMALMAYRIGPGDVVFTTPFTFIATAEVIALLGAIPVFVDIIPHTFNIDPSRLELAIEAFNKEDPNIYPLPRALYRQHLKGRPEKSNKGIIAVDLFGLPADYDRINALAKNEGLFVIGDAAQSFGATFKGEKVGTLTDVTATSFFPAKPLGCYGDGGAVLTDDDDLSATIRSIRLHGKGKEKYDNVRIGINGRLDTLQAAILLEKLKIFPWEVERRNLVAQQYSENLKNIVEIPFVPEEFMSVWAQYSIMSDQKESLQDALKKAGIPTAVYYPKPLHLQTAFSYLGYKEGDFPNSEKISKRIFSLPMHPYLKEDQIKRIALVISKTANSHK